MRERAVCIIIDTKDRTVLLMHRIKAGREYMTLPGGKIEPGETPELALARSVHQDLPGFTDYWLSR